MTIGMKITKGKVTFLLRGGGKPTQGSIIIMRAGIGHTMLNIIMRQERIGRAGKSKLQDAHPRQTELRDLITMRVSPK